MPLLHGKTEKFQQQLLAWYDVHARILPWRVSPQALARGEKPQAYRVWLSEIMLQQTTVEAVKPYFAKFICQWPNLTALSAAKLDDVLKAWAGLGYYSRARNLKACAEKLMADYGGQFPQTAAKLRALPGIGAYTSAAIAAIAFDEACAVADANIERVIARLFAINTPLPAAKAEILCRCRRLTPPRRPGDFAQAMMDLGATLCAPKRPNCLLCPVRQFCAAAAAGKAATLPRKTQKPPREERRGCAFVAISARGRVYLQKRAATGLLGGMSEVPNYFAKAENGQDAAASGADLRHAPFQAAWQFQGRITHIFTHFRLSLNIYKAECVSENAALQPAGGAAQAVFWAAAENLAHEALPALFKKAVACALPEAFNGASFAARPFPSQDRDKDREKNSKGKRDIKRT